MPKELSEVLAQMEEEYRKSEELRKKGVEFVSWMNSNAEDVSKKILAILRENSEKVYTSKELFEMIFGNEKCSLQEEDSGKCGKCQNEMPPSHQFECDFCKHAALFMKALNSLALENKITVYDCEKETWVGMVK